MSPNTSKRVAVTGLGIITAIGASVSEFTQGLLDGKSGIGPVSLFDTTGFPCQVAAQVNSPDLKAPLDLREVKRTSRCDLLGLFAAQEAVSDSGLDLELYDRGNIGVVLGGGAGGMLSWERRMFPSATWEPCRRSRSRSCGIILGPCMKVLERGTPRTD